MSSPMDDVSFKLGEISAGLAILAAKTEKIDQHLETVSDHVLGIRGTIAPAVADLVWMKPQVEHYQRVRGRATWAGGVFVTVVVAVIGAISGAVSNYIFKRYGA